MIERFLAALPLLLAFTSSASAGVVFDNFPISGADANIGDSVSAPWITSDSFTLSSSATVSGVNFGGLVYSWDNLPATIKWAIGTSEFDTGLGSGTANLSSTLLYDYTGTYGYYVYEMSFSVPDIPVSAGTYYLSLSNTAPGEYVQWDINNGPGIDVWQTDNVDTAHLSDASWCEEGTCANSFQILGTEAPVPEPGTAVLLFPVLLVVTAALRRKSA